MASLRYAVLLLAPLVGSQREVTGGNETQQLGMGGGVSEGSGGRTLYNRVVDPPYFIVDGTVYLMKAAALNEYFKQARAESGRVVRYLMENGPNNNPPTRRLVAQTHDQETRPWYVYGGLCFVGICAFFVLVGTVTASQRAEAEQAWLVNLERPSDEEALRYTDLMQTQYFEAREDLDNVMIDHDANAKMLAHALRQHRELESLALMSQLESPADYDPVELALHHRTLDEKAEQIDELVVEVRREQEAALIPERLQILAMTQQP